MTNPVSKTSRANPFMTYLILGIIALAMLFPLFWLLSTSLKSPTEDIFGSPLQILPVQPTLANFLSVWQNYPFGRYLFNSTIVASLTVGFNLLFCALAAYPLARLNFRGRDLLLALIVATLMIPFQIVMIPLYILTVQFGLRNTYLGVIFPGLASAFGIFLLRQAFQGVPKELEEAARIDGCTELGIWWHIMIIAQLALHSVEARIQRAGAGWQRAGIRLAGLMLAMMAAIALWAIALGQPHPFCGPR